MISVDCLICLSEMVSPELNTDHVNRKPVLICQNGHSICESCLNIIREQQGRNYPCPSCRGRILDNPIPNIEFANLIESVVKARLRGPSRTNDDPEREDQTQLLAVNHDDPIGPAIFYPRPSAPYDDSDHENMANASHFIGPSIRNQRHRMARPRDFKELHMLGFFILRCFSDVRWISDDQEALVYLGNRKLVFFVPSRCKDVAVSIGRKFIRIFGQDAVRVGGTKIRVVGTSPYFEIMAIRSPRKIIQLLLALGFSITEIYSIVLDAIRLEDLIMESFMHQKMIGYLEELRNHRGVLEPYRQMIIEAMQNFRRLPHNIV